MLDPVPVIDPAVKVTAPTVSVYVPKANIAVDPLTVTAPEEIASLIPNVKLPAETVVRPVYVLLPDKVNVPAPALVTVVADPEITPE